MKLLDRLGYTVDRALGVLNPAAALRRAEARRQSSAFFERMYAAARPTKDASGWRPIDPDVNTAIRTSAQPVRARVRQLVRDFAYFDRAVRLSSALVVGEGIRLQAHFYDAAGKALTDVNSRIESAWLRWCEQCDFAGRLNFAEMQELAERQRMECGEYLFVLRYDKRNFTLQAVESDRLTTVGAIPDKGNELDSGIEYDAVTGEVKYYWITQGSYLLKTVRVPAQFVIHGFRTLRPGQLRGISPLASSVLIAGDLAELLDSELDATRLTSKWLGFVTSNDVPGFQDARKDSTAKGRHVEFLDNCQLEYLRNGDSIELAKMSRQGDTFEPFLCFNLRTLAVGAGLTYELLTGNYDHISYSNLRGIRLDLATTLRPTQLFHINHLCRPVFEHWLRWVMLAQPSLLPSSLQPLQPWNHRWIAPGMESADPLKEIKAFADEMALGVRSPQEWCARRGRDLEDVLDEIAEARQMAEERGISLGDVSTAMASNPAALEDNDNA